MRNITVSRKSWHFRLYALVRTPPLIFWLFDRDEFRSQRYDALHRTPGGFCAYFWSVAFALLTFVPRELLTPLVLLALAIILAPFYGIYRLASGYRAWRRGQPPGKVSLLATYMAARKARVCPRVVVAEPDASLR